MSLLSELEKLNSMKLCLCVNTTVIHTLEEAKMCHLRAVSCKSELENELKVSCKHTVQGSKVTVRRTGGKITCSLQESTGFICPSAEYVSGVTFPQKNNNFFFLQKTEQAQLLEQPAKEKKLIQFHLFFFIKPFAPAYPNETQQK